MAAIQYCVLLPDTPLPQGALLFPSEAVNPDMVLGIAAPAAEGWQHQGMSISHPTGNQYEHITDYDASNSDLNLGMPQHAAGQLPMGFAAPQGPGVAFGGVVNNHNAGMPQHAAGRCPARRAPTDAATHVGKVVDGLEFPFYEWEFGLSRSTTMEELKAAYGLRRDAPGAPQPDNQEYDVYRAWYKKINQWVERARRSAAKKANGTRREQKQAVRAQPTASVANNRTDSVVERELLSPANSF